MTIQSTLRPVNSHNISVSDTAAKNTSAFKNSDIRIYCATACYIKLGGSTVVATTTAGTGYDQYIPAGVETDIHTGGATYISIILASGTDTAYINEWTKGAL